VHAVSYLFRASVVCFGRSDESWEQYTRWMSLTWRGQVDEVIEELVEQQTRLGEPTGDCDEDDPSEQLRKIVGYLRNNCMRMQYDEYRRAGLPVTSAWMESAVKEINYRTKGSDMFWNNPRGAEAILHVRAASLCDDDRLVRFLLRRRGSPTLRREKFLPETAA
ncbi:MAG: LysR family transcriptional regulator, partial [Planctomycetota bacterium]